MTLTRPTTTKETINHATKTTNKNTMKNKIKSTSIVLSLIVTLSLLCLGAFAQSPGNGNALRQIQPVILQPTITNNSGTNNIVSYSPLLLGGTGSITIVSGTLTTGQTLSGTGAIAGALVGSPVLPTRPSTFPANATLSGIVTASGTVVLTVSASGTGSTAITTGTGIKVLTITY